MSEYQERGKKHNVETSRNERRDTEFAADMAQPIREDQRFTGDTAQETEAPAAGRSLGWLALSLAIASLFVFPQWLSLAGIILGGAAWFTGIRGLGLWSIVIGAISLVAYIVLVPYYS